MGHLRQRQNDSLSLSARSSRLPATPPPASSSSSSWPRPVLFSPTEDDTCDASDPSLIPSCEHRDGQQAIPLQRLPSHRHQASSHSTSEPPWTSPSAIVSTSTNSAIQHDHSSFQPHEAIASTDMSLTNDRMATSSRAPFFDPSTVNTNSPYGTLSRATSRDASLDGSDSASDDAHPLRRVPSTLRSITSKRSGLSRTSSHLSEDLDGAALASGLDSRFGMADVPLVGTVVDKDKRNDESEEGVPLGESDTDSDEAYDREHQENSPHEAVRASVPPTDDTSLSINTPRMWCLSVLFSVLGSSTNLFFSLRYPSVAITPVIALLLVHPLGLLWDFLLKRSHDPNQQFVDGTRVRAPELSPSSSLMSWRLWLAQGKWNEKEHTCVYVSSNVAFGFAFATDVIVEQTKFYNQEAPIIYQLLLTISTQILGYGFAGLTRRFLVRPSGMIWPGTLMSAAMFGTLHRQDNKPANGWTISRWNFFYLVWAGSSLFYFLPGLLMPALSYFNVLTWLAPKNIVVANLFGVSSGLGLFPLTFDWAQVTYVGSPLLVPFWAAVNVVAGLAIVMWVVAPIMYYANVLWTSHMPILSSAVFDNTGQVYNVTKILTPDFVFDRQAYTDYSRVFLPVTYMLSYAMQFAGLAALLTHTACWYGGDIYRQCRKAITEARQDGKPSYVPLPDSAEGSDDDDGSNTQGRRIRTSHLGRDSLAREDIHCRLMRRYEDVPIWWYLTTFASMAAIGIFVVEYYPVHLPWYGLLLALSIGAVFFIPNGIIMAITNQHSSIYLICQLICGAVFPGRPIANMVFVTYGYISSAQGIKFASDLKLGHYMKIPPRTMFTVQVVATLVSSVTQIGVLNWMFANIKGLCTSKAVNGFTCPIARVHFNGSILWGVVGVGEFFGPQAMYRALVWAFPLGAILPIPLWLYARGRKQSILRKVNLPVIFGAMAWIPPATGLNFSVWALVCYIFNYRIKRRASAWWAKYTMTLSAALDSGLACGIVIVFFGFIYSGLMQGFSWWGTEVYKQGCDWQACPYMPLAEGERFGPETW